MFFRMLFFLLLSTQSLGAVCHGRFINPVSDINWNAVFPIRIGGVKVDLSGGSQDSDQTVTRGVCVCPSHVLGLPVPGIVVTFHEPMFVEEIVKTPGCLSSLGGLAILKGYENEQTDLKEDANSSSRWQVHWYEYPVFALLDVFRHFACLDHSLFALAYMTEVDPTWQDDAWGAMYSPEAAIFTSEKAQAACMVDALGSNRGHPIDHFFWCAGSWGPVYPLTGNANASVSRLQSANLVGAKMIARLAKMGFLWKTVGGDTLCEAKPMPVWVKSEFSLDPVYPRIHHGPAVPIGASPLLWESQPVQTYPGYENINQVVFQEQQCCLRP